MSRLSFVILISYDFRQALLSLPTMATIADEFLLAIERRRRLFTGDVFPFPENGCELLERACAPVPVRFVEWDSLLAPAGYVALQQLDTSIRNACSHLCKAGNWIMSPDADEVLLNANEFWVWLQTQEPPRPGSGHNRALYTRNCTAVFKVIGDKAIIAETAQCDRRPVQVGCEAPGEFKNSRNTWGTRLESPLELLHWSYGRTREEVELKLRWASGYMGDGARLLELWDSVTVDNCGRFTDFWPHGDGRSWHRLRAIPYADALAGRLR